MLKNYVRSTFRSLWKNKGHSLINIVGLSLGISCTIIIFTIVRFELSFDDYHPEKERLYRIVTEYHKYEEKSYNAGITYVLPEALRQDFPDLEYVSITDSNNGDPVITVTGRDGSNKLFKQTQTTFADPDYFKMLHYDWLEGSPADGLSREKTVVLTESVARKFFGNSTALNQVINYNNKYDLTVSGVVKDAPLNTSFPFSMIISNKLGADKHGWDNWTATSSSINCIVQLKKGVNALDFQNKMKGWHLKYFKGTDKEDGEARTYFLQPLSAIHFDDRFSNYNRIITNQSLIALSLIGLLLFLTACINFVNLNSVLIVNRSKEVGVRKVMGSGKIHLILQFLGETFLITMISMGVSVAMVELAMMNLNPVLGYTLKFTPFADGIIAFFILALPFLVTLIAGLYPAMSLASFQPIKALKNKMVGGESKGVTLRRTLIAFQLIISQALVISTIIIVQQIDFFGRQPLGLNSSAVVEFEIPERKGVDLRAMKERLQNIPGIQDVTMNNTGSTGENSWGGDFDATVNGKRVKEYAAVKFADEDYLKTYQLALLAGRDLARSDTANLFLVNEAFVRALGLKDPADAIGVSVEYWGRSRKLIQGVVKNFHTSSLHSKISPLIIMAGTDFFFTTAIRLQTKNSKEVMDKVEQTWKMTFPKYIFEYTFLDETIRNFYAREKRTSTLITVFAVVAVLIGSIGLLGLVSFMVTKRTKEVGIRKTLGASVGNIMTLFSKEFVILILISFSVAAPAAYYAMGQWLENFAYHIEPGIFTFGAGVVLSLIVVLGTVSFISYKAAVANPVLALKEE
jgi:ABC-type antimicrobial peptide transport system permease subunit